MRPKAVGSSYFRLHGYKTNPSGNIQYEAPESDLNFLYGWRNAEDHPKDVILTDKDVFQVVNRSAAFYESIKASLNEFEFFRFRLSSKHSKGA